MVHTALEGRRTLEKKDDILSPISGKVIKVLVAENAPVKKNEDLMIIEAMKMEYRIKAPYDGTVTKIHFKKNDQIDMGAKPLEIKKRED